MEEQNRMSQKMSPFEKLVENLPKLNVNLKVQAQLHTTTKISAFFVFF